MNIPRIERETTIIFNEEESVASIWTCSPVMMRKLDKLCKDAPETYKCVLVDDKTPAKRYEMPKRYISFRKPVERVLTDEQKAALSERAKAMRMAAKKAKEAE